MISEIDGTRILIEKDVEMEIKEPYHSAYLKFGWRKCDSFGINIKIINIAQSLKKNLIINSNGRKFTADVWSIANFIGEHNSFMKIKNVTLGIIPEYILKVIV